MYSDFQGREDLLTTAWHALTQANCTSYRLWVWPCLRTWKDQRNLYEKTYGPVRINTADRPDMLFDLNHDSLGSQGWLMTLREG